MLIPVGSFREILLNFLDPRLTYNQMVWLHCTMCGHEYNQKLYPQDTVKNNIKLHDENKILSYYLRSRGTPWAHCYAFI